jgi:hypothetical protein
MRFYTAGRLNILSILCLNKIPHEGRFYGLTCNKYLTM